MQNKELIINSLTDQLSEFGRYVESNIHNCNQHGQQNFDSYKKVKDQIMASVVELKNNLQSLTHQSEQQSFKQVLASLQKQLHATSNDYQLICTHFEKFGYDSPQTENKENMVPQPNVEDDAKISDDQFPLNATPKLEGLSNFALEAIRKQNIDDLQIGMLKKSESNFIGNTKAPDNETPPSPDFKTPGLKRSKKCLQHDVKSTNKADECSVSKRPQTHYDIAEIESPCVPTFTTPGLISRSTVKCKTASVQEPAPVVDSICASFLGNAGINNSLCSPNRSDKDNLSTLVSEATAAIRKISAEEYHGYVKNISNSVDLEFLNQTIAKLNSLVVQSEIAGERLVIDKALLCEKIGINNVKCNHMLLQLYKLKRLRKSSVAGKYLVR